MLRLGQAEHLRWLQLPLLGQRVGSTRKRGFSAGMLLGDGSCEHRILQRSEIAIISRKDKTNSGRTEDGSSRQQRLAQGAVSLGDGKDELRLRRLHCSLGKYPLTLSLLAV